MAQESEADAGGDRSHTVVTFGRVIANETAGACLEDPDPQAGTEDEMGGKSAHAQRQSGQKP
jgi:hypothetical protein